MSSAYARRGGRPADPDRRGAGRRRRQPRGVPGADRRAGALGGRDERDRQHGRSRARFERRGGDRPRPGRCRADPPGRLPRQEPDRLPGGHRRRGVSRRREHLLPDRRRRHGRRRARGAASVRPRRPAADRGRDRPLAGPLPLGTPDRAGAGVVRRRRRERGRAADRAPRAAGGEEDPGRRALPAAPDLLPPGPARGLCPRTRGGQARRTGRAPARDRARQERPQPAGS